MGVAISASWTAWARTVGRCSSRAAAPMEVRGGISGNTPVRLAAQIVEIHDVPGWYRVLTDLP